MDPNLLLAAICIGVSLLIIVMVAVVGRGMSLRAAAWWIGLACLPIAALISGMVPRMIDAWNVMAVDWWQQLERPFTVPVMAGLALGGIGFLLLFGSRLIPYKKRQKKPKTTAATPAPAPARPKPDYTPSATSTATPSDRTP
nr:hypothetical protein [Propionibacterium sp.]